MSHQEVKDAWDSLKAILLLVMPGLIAACITSSVDFLDKHWLKDKFSWNRFIVGHVSDITLGAAVYLGLYEIGVGEAGRLAAVYVAVSAGRLWVRRVIDDRLGMNRKHGADKHERDKGSR
ncbi:MAG: hypothetical protein Q4C86_09900 [bacterium]|nr:hypothetical protein [bacterium]